MIDDDDKTDDQPRQGLRTHDRLAAARPGACGVTLPAGMPVQLVSSANVLAIAARSLAENGYGDVAVEAAARGLDEGGYAADAATQRNGDH